ncbi:hypothetical protein BIV57_08100 [Mangrovactinospora gilvigrisea]|uniref:Uncharacterized protein n=1 Tax=Mangrovactinospora gilvigrisea TaxID=1428644 RepID=A0A1J7C8Y2_9ACTN|nr:hypothetical protein [Mangrovactinospora gilvigrisea]OIV37988.1 hypothetical protein BIV57_08100 [Mangrovactinospora gilvigrisea]
MAEYETSRYEALVALAVQAVGPLDDRPYEQWLGQIDRVVTDLHLKTVSTSPLMRRLSALLIAETTAVWWTGVTGGAPGEELKATMRTWDAARGDWRECIAVATAATTASERELHQRARDLIGHHVLLYSTRGDSEDLGRILHLVDQGPIPDFVPPEPRPASPPPAAPAARPAEPGPAAPRLPQPEPAVAPQEPDEEETGTAIHRIVPIQLPTPVPEPVAVPLAVAAPASPGPSPAAAPQPVAVDVKTAVPAPTPPVPTSPAPPAERPTAPVPAPVSAPAPAAPAPTPDSAGEVLAWKEASVAVWKNIDRAWDKGYRTSCLLAIRDRAIVDEAGNVLNLQELLDMARFSPEPQSPNGQLITSRYAVS